MYKRLLVPCAELASQILKSQEWLLMEWLLITSITYVNLVIKDKQIPIEKAIRKSTIPFRFDWVWE